MERDAVWELLTENLTNKNLRKHCLAAEAVMRARARRLGEDEGLWGLAGLVHDVDYDRTAEQPDLHAELGAQMLEERGYPREVVGAVNPARNSTAASRAAARSNDLDRPESR